MPSRRSSKQMVLETRGLRHLYSLTPFGDSVAHTTSVGSWAGVLQLHKSNCKQICIAHSHTNFKEKINKETQHNVNLDFLGTSILGNISQASLCIFEFLHDP